MTEEDKKVPLLTDSHTIFPHEISSKTIIKEKKPHQQANFINPFSIGGKNSLPPLNQKLFTPSKPIKTNKSFYSDQVISGSKINSTHTDAPLIESLLWKSNTPGKIPQTNYHSTKVNPLTKKAKLSAIGKTTQDLRQTDFKPESFKPKVQIPFIVPPSHKPRRVQVERDRREFEIEDPKRFLELLEKFGIKNDDLLPPQVYNRIYKPKYNSYRDDFTYKRYLSLDIFDNTEFDSRTSTEWMSIGNNNPVPALALLPEVIDEELFYGWSKVGVVGFEELDQETKWFVQTVDKHGRVKFNLKSLQNKMCRFPKESNQFVVPRCNLFFLSENPKNFASRIKEAVNHRNEVEGLLRKALYVDCMPTYDVPTTISIEKIIKRAGCQHILTAGKFDKALEAVQKQVLLVEKKAENLMVFEKNSVDKSFIIMKASVGENLNIGKVNKIDIKDEFDLAKKLGYNFKAQKQRFEFKSLYTRPEPIRAMVNIRELCNEMMTAKGSLFNTILSKPQRLEEFEQTQLQQQNLIKLFLQDSWINQLKNQVRQGFQYIVQSWFNINEIDWSIYEQSKLSKFMNTAKFIMQDSLRSLVQKSVNDYVSLVENMCMVCKMKDENTWPSESLKCEQFFPKNRKTSLFVINLKLEDFEATFSTDLELFEEKLVHLFNNAISSTSAVPQLEKFVMEKLFWEGQSPLLESVGIKEPWVCESRKKLQNAINMALKPMKVYSKQFEKFNEIMSVDVKEFLSELDAKNPTAQEIKDQVDIFIQKQGEMEKEIPSNIIIGPFQVITDTIRTSLSKKCKTLSNAVLDYLAQKLRTRADEGCDTFKTIYNKLCAKCNSIEDLDEMRNWMETIPDTIHEERQQINATTTDYDLLDEYYYQLPQEDFDSKWVAIMWPNKLETRLEKTYGDLEEQEKEFLKNQKADQTAFADRIEDISRTILSFSAYNDIDKSQEVSNQVKRIVKDLATCQNLAGQYNNRERIFGMNVTNYDKISKLEKQFQRYKDLWTQTNEFQKSYQSWFSDPLLNIDPEALESIVSESMRTFHKAIKQFNDVEDVRKVAEQMKQKVEAFQPYVPLIQGLRNPGMRVRHWESLSEDLGFKVMPSKDLTFQKCLDKEMDKHIDKIAKVAEIAGKEYSIEVALDQMYEAWGPVNFEIKPYKDTGTYIMKPPEEASQLLDDHIVMTQSMAFSPYKAPFEERIEKWEKTLRLCQDVLDEWLVVQSSWLYLEPIFSSDDINRQLPVEAKRYQNMERAWRHIMKGARDNTVVIEICNNQRTYDSLVECNRLLEQVQKGLSEYLETKRLSFPRFFFLSDDELLEILSQTKDPKAVQPHLRKCFENIAKITFMEDLAMTQMVSGEGEKVDFVEKLYPTGNVEFWLNEVERVMKGSVNDQLSRSLIEYPTIPRTEWVLNWPGQVVIAGSQVFWSSTVEEAIQNHDLVNFSDKLMGMLQDLVHLVRGKLTPMERMIMSALIVIEVHAKDVVLTLRDGGVETVNDFEWISQLRYYYQQESKNCILRAVNAKFDYGNEYLGNSGRLVITPLTDRCYLTLTGALHLKFGGAPAGPAGTGKTETTKDLAKAMAIQCVVFNCSDQLDYMAMAKFFKGLAASGAWACFDEFNRINIEVLSVVAQQIATIRNAMKAEAERFMFEGTELQLRMTCASFITMNPGYAGRTELPDNLKALFRPVAMMVPNYTMIAEISLYSFGFGNAKELANKITTTFKLSSEQLSSQDHYDFGMRAVKTVISAAGNLKRENPNQDEQLICLRAIRDVNVPKFLLNDLKLFNGIVSDLFPDTKEEAIDYGILLESLKDACTELGLQAVDGFMTKCIQLYETTVVRHGLMLVGPTVSGKTCCYKVLANAISRLKGQDSISGGKYQAVDYFCLNPKSITMGQLYGEFDLMTHEWTDGILSTLIRRGCASDDNRKKWFMFDGPVDAVWIENMNTVLDDNKKLCLSSGEIIKLTDDMTMMFEVQDLTVASPATVSRCGMVYLEPNYIGLDPFVKCWIDKLTPDVNNKNCRPILEKLFKFFMADGIQFCRLNCKEYSPTVDGSLTFSLLKLMDTFLEVYKVVEGQPTLLPSQKSRIPDLLEPFFIFCYIWAIGSGLDTNSRPIFSEHVRKQIKQYKLKIPFPEKGSVFDYRLDQADLTTKYQPGDVDDESIFETVKISWIPWLNDAPKFKITCEMQFSDIIVPTVDTIRNAALIEMLLKNKKQVLCVGPTGTSKSVVIRNKLLKGMPDNIVPFSLGFSAKTSSNQTQDLIDSKLDKRRKGIFGPPVGKQAIFFIDDLNMPALEEYGAQPPIELIRQWMDHDGWYDRKNIGSFSTLIDITFIGAMGPPGGGRNQISLRLSRHFNQLTFTEMSDISKARIFKTMIDEGWLIGNMSKSAQGKSAPETLTEDVNLMDQLIKSTIEVYNTISINLLPTPAKSHYTFNLRDLSKVFQGMTMHEITAIPDIPYLLRLWFHESSRVFYDRLVNDEDRVWFDNLMKSKIAEFGFDPKDVIPEDKPVLFGDQLSNNDPKPYTYIENISDLSRMVNDTLDDYNAIATAPMKLVLFMDAIKHITRICRIIRQPLGNALLLGMGGSGRQSLSKLAAYCSDYKLFQIELSKNYGMVEWRDDVKAQLLQAGISGEPLVFLFSDTQIKSETFLEDINNILNSGDVPNIYANDELEQIYNAMKSKIGNQTPTKSNLFNEYQNRVRSNLHMIICMSPIGEIFRARLRQFPSLVTCCTIDWFTEWPDEALTSVSKEFLGDLPALNTEGLIESMCKMCVYMHQSIVEKSKQFLAELGRHNYVTPTSYLDLLKVFAKLIGMKASEIKTAKDRMSVGLNKLLKTADDVAGMQVELEEMGPELKIAQKETAETMVKIEADTIVANDTRQKVSKQEKEAIEKAAKAQAIAEDAQRDLDEALPALDAAVASLKSLQVGDIVEVRALMRPPQGVKMVMEAVCIMKGIKPKRVPGEKPGTKIDDYWGEGKSLLQDPRKFLDSLFNFDKENIPEDRIKKIEAYYNDEEFTPENIERVSKACKSLCLWVRAMYKFDQVVKSIAPKRAALEEASLELEETNKQLAAAKAVLTEVENNLAMLDVGFQKAIAKKKELEENVELCKNRLIRADQLIGGLSEEKVRWAENVKKLTQDLVNVVGDILICSGCIAYLAPFTGEYRSDVLECWNKELKNFNVPGNDGANLVQTLGDPVKIRAWQIAGLPKDNLSTDNALTVQYSERWPLFIDPQGQANGWVKTMEKEKGLEVLKLTNKDFLRSLENAIRFGKPILLENVLEELDPALEPILLKQTFKQAGSTVIKLGDSVIPYHPDFKMYITTKLPNPHYTPEISTKVTVINFTLAPSGLEDQLLGYVVAEERPDLEEAKNQLIVTNAKMKADLAEIEDQILYRLSASEGNPVDDVELIAVLQASKAKAFEIQGKVKIAEETEKDIDETRSKYVPVSVRAQILFFCVGDMANIDPMYQYSLEWFIRIFLGSIHSSEKSEDIEERLKNINDFETFSLYTNVCRSLFEKHKLLFAFLLTIRIEMNYGRILMNEYRVLLSGGAVTVNDDNPLTEWLSERAWLDIRTTETLDTYKGLYKSFMNPDDIPIWKAYFDNQSPQTAPLPEYWENKLDNFQKLMILKCLRPDKLTNGMQNYIAVTMGSKFIEPQTVELADVYGDSSPIVPIVFVLSQGTDPAANLNIFAEKMKMDKKLASISLGQGQGPIAEAAFNSGVERGKWVFFQNCHLSPSWMPSLEKLIEGIDKETVHRDFRVWLTSMPSPKFPVSILQNSSKMTVEPPKGIKANLIKAYGKVDADFLGSCTKIEVFKNLLFSLCLFHGVILERRKYGALGFNIPYEFTDGDLGISQDQLRMFLDEYTKIPFKVLTYTAGHINYGGRVTDDWDRRCLMSILSGFYDESVLASDFNYDDSAIYHQLDPENSAPHQIMEYIMSLPINDTPEIFGLHDNANITFAQSESYTVLGDLVKLQAGGSGGSSGNIEEVVFKMAEDLLAKCPPVWDLVKIVEQYPVMYEQSMNTVLAQEVVRYNGLLGQMNSSLMNLKKAIKGLVVMDDPLEKMFNSIYENTVPKLWESKAYPSLKPLAAWMLDLLERVSFIQNWIDNGVPAVAWISGFFFPQAFLTGTLQNFARRTKIPIDTISFGFEVIRPHYSEVVEGPADGCYIRGLFIEAARWDFDNMVLTESRPKELYTDFATIWLKPFSKREKPTEGIYECPIYKTLQRAGTLSTTGHSTNFVIGVELPSDKSQRHWIKRGVALFCALNY